MTLGLADLFGDLVELIAAGDRLRSSLVFRTPLLAEVLVFGAVVRRITHAVVDVFFGAGFLAVATGDIAFDIGASGGDRAGGLKAIALGFEFGEIGGEASGLCHGGWGWV